MEQNLGTGSPGIDYPIIVTDDEDLDVVMMQLPLVQKVVIKCANLRVRMHRDLLERAGQAMVQFFDIGDEGHIRIIAANGSVLYRIVHWNPTMWWYDCVLVEHTDHMGIVHRAPALEGYGSVPLRTVL